MKYAFKTIFLIISLSALIFGGSVNGQNQTYEEGGIIITKKGDITTYYDKFTGQHAITISDAKLYSSLNNDNDSTPSYIIPFYVYGGDIFDKAINALVRLTEWEDGFNLILVRNNSEEHFFNDDGPKSIPFLIDNQRVPKSGYFLKNSSTEIIEITFSTREWKTVVESEST